MNQRIVLTGGGTGGHAYPAISIGDALRREHPDTKLLYIGSRGGPEARLASDAGVEYLGLCSRKLKRLMSPDTLLTVAALAKGFGEALGALNRFKPDLVIGTGGYASAAVVIAQALRGGKTLIHEQNAVPGRTNLWLSRFASRVCVTFESSAGCFPKGKTVLTGLPIRSGLMELPGRAEARRSLGLDPDVFTLLVYGGSQGASALNKVVAESLSVLRSLPIQVIHQTGVRNYAAAERLRESADWPGYHVCPYFDDVRPVFASTDLALTRCGASTIAEITAIGIPSLLVPYPYAYADHQRHNGLFVADSGGGLMADERDLTTDLLAKVVRRFLASPDDLNSVASASRRLGRPNAAHDIAAIAVGLE